MPTVTPFIPQTITVHLGAPSANAANVTVDFADYVKNVASSEIYPTWDESALRANILAITSFALNRVYTEFYRSRGYDFDITNSTAIDQYFVNGRAYFENISELVDELFNDYLRRPGFVEPLAAKFCNGTTVTCEGLSQWGSQNLATQGYNSDQILRSYYGNIETVINAPIRDNTSSYPGTPLRLGSSGPNVVIIQTSLNRISQNYPAIPKIPQIDGIYGPRTEASVKALQQIFGLRSDGIVGPATWYLLVRLYTAVTSLSELRSQGQKYYAITWSPPNVLQIGDTGEQVEFLQYMLQTLSTFIPEIPPVTIDGVYGIETRSAVLASQRRFRLPETGTVGAATWNEIYAQYSGIETNALRSNETFPRSNIQTTNTQANRNVRQVSNIKRSNNLTSQLFNSSTTLTQFPGRDLTIGSKDPVNQEVVR